MQLSDTGVSGKSIAKTRLYLRSFLVATGTRMGLHPHTRPMILATSQTIEQGGWTGNGRTGLNLVCINHLILHIHVWEFRKGAQIRSTW